MKKREAEEAAFGDDIAGGAAAGLIPVDGWIVGFSRSAAPGVTPSGVKEGETEVTGSSCDDVTADSDGFDAAAGETGSVTAEPLEVAFLANFVSSVGALISLADTAEQKSSGAHDASSMRAVGLGFNRLSNTLPRRLSLRGYPCILQQPIAFKQHFSD